MQFGIGQPVTRKEDPKFLTGQGRYVDDIDFPNMTYAAVHRSIHANANIKFGHESGKSEGDRERGQNHNFPHLPSAENLDEIRRGDPADRRVFNDPRHHKQIIAHKHDARSYRPLR